MMVVFDHLGGDTPRYEKCCGAYGNALRNRGMFRSPRQGGFGTRMLVFFDRNPCGGAFLLHCDAVFRRQLVESIGRGLMLRRAENERRASSDEGCGQRADHERRVVPMDDLIGLHGSFV